MVLPFDAQAEQWAWLALSGIVGFVIGDLLLFQSYVIIGARIAMLIMALAPPITAFAGWLNRILQGMSREDLFTVVHERFMTDTALYADIVLPATSSVEHADAYRSYGHYGVQRVKACIPPVGEAKSNWEVFCLLAQAMGLIIPGGPEMK